MKHPLLLMLFASLTQFCSGQDSLQQNNKLFSITTTFGALYGVSAIRKEDRSTYRSLSLNYSDSYFYGFFFQWKEFVKLKVQCEQKEPLVYYDLSLMIPCTKWKYAAAHLPVLWIGLKAETSVGAGPLVGIYFSERCRLFTGYAVPSQKDKDFFNGFRSVTTKLQYSF